MRTIAIGFMLTGLLRPALFGQAKTEPSEERVLQLKNIATVPEFEEIAKLISLITEAANAGTDDAQMSMTVRGSAEQIGLAEWLVKELDRPAGGTAVPASLEYKGLPERDAQGRMTQDGVARIFYLSHAATVQDFQEIINAVRTVTEIRRAFGYNDGRAVAVRGTKEQLAMAEWAFQQVDQPVRPDQAEAKGAAARDYDVGKDDVMRIVEVPNAKTVQDFQEIANAVRTTTEIRRMFTYNTGRVVLERATPEQLAMAEWLFKELDQPSGAQLSQASGEYRVPGAADDVVKVYHLPNTASVQAFQEEATAVRTAAGIRRVFTYNAQRALALRGTASQLALAEVLMKDMAGPKQ